MLPTEDDNLSAENLIEENIKHYCRVMDFAHKISPPIMPSSEPSGNVTSIEGLGCEQNFTLYMVALDSVRNHHFAESLGIDIRNKEDMTAVVILDSKVRYLYISFFYQVCN